VHAPIDGQEIARTPQEAQVGEWISPPNASLNLSVPQADQTGSTRTRPFCTRQILPKTRTNDIRALNVGDGRQPPRDKIDDRWMVNVMHKGHVRALVGYDLADVTDGAGDGTRVIGLRHVTSLPDLKLQFWRVLLSIDDDVRVSSALEIPYDLVRISFSAANPGVIL